MTLREMLQCYLSEIDADGLCNPGCECGCPLAELAPLGDCLDLDECLPARSCRLTIRGRIWIFFNSSSEHIREPPKMVGFDLEKARAADEALPYPLDANEIWVSGKGQMHINPPNAPSIFFTLSDLCEFRNLFHGQAAEIERLRAELARVNQLREIEIDQAGASERIYREAARLKDARIKELEDALVEELARGDYFDESQECEGYWWDRKNTSDCTQNDYRRNARLKLQADGKIGPDADAKPREGLYGKYRISKADGSPVDPNADYFVLRLDTDPVARRAAREYSYMTVDRKLALELQERITKYNPKMMDCINLQFFGVEKPRVWQITEERKAALKRLYGLLVIRYKYSYPDETETLRAMLEEAGV